MRYRATTDGHTVEDFLIERDGEEIPVTATAKWHFERGDFIEPFHRYNYHNRGWCCDEITAKDSAGRPVELTEREQDRIREITHPNQFSKD